MTSKNPSGVGNWNQLSKQQKVTLIVVISLVALVAVLYTVLFVMSNNKPLHMAVALLVTVLVVMFNNKPSHNIEAQTTKQEEPKKEEAKPVEKVKAKRLRVRR